MKMIQVTTNVIRQGKSFEIATEKVAVGDIISLSAGDMVPADMRLLQTKDLFASTSSLNGESAPVEKKLQLPNLKMMKIILATKTWLTLALTL